MKASPFPHNVRTLCLGELQLVEELIDAIQLRHYEPKLPVTMDGGGELAVIVWPPEDGIDDEGVFSRFVDRFWDNFWKGFESIGREILPFVNEWIDHSYKRESEASWPSAEQLCRREALHMVKINATTDVMNSHEIVFALAAYTGYRDLVVSLDPELRPVLVTFDGAQ